MAIQFANKRRDDALAWLRPERTSSSVAISYQSKEASFAGALTLTVQHLPQNHKDGKNQQIAGHGLAMGVKGCNDHEQAADNGQSRHEFSWLTEYNDSNRRSSRRRSACH